MIETLALGFSARRVGTSSGHDGQTHLVRPTKALKDSRIGAEVGRVPAVPDRTA